MKRRLTVVGCLSLACVLAAPTGRAADLFVEVGDILTANYLGNSVLKINPADGTQASLGTFPAPTDITLSPDGHLYICELQGAIKRLTLTNGTVTRINPATSSTAARGMARAPSGDLFVTGSLNRVLRVNPVTGAETVITQGNNLSLPTGVEVLDADHVVVASFLNNNIVKVAVADGTQSVIASGGAWIDRPWGLAVSGDSVYAGHYDSKLINRISASSGLVTPIGSVPGFPYGIGLDAGGNIVVGAAASVPGQPDLVVLLSPAGTVTAEFSGGDIRQITGIEVATARIGPVIPANTPPQAGNDVIERDPAVGSKLPLITMLGNDIDADGDPIELISVDALSANGGAVTWGADWVFYTPLPGDTEDDFFTYTIADPRGAQSTGTVSVLVILDGPPASNLTVTDLGNGSFLLHFDGIPGRTYRIEYTDSLISPVWLPLGSETADPIGAFQHTDTPPGGLPRAGYRSVFP